MDLWFIFYPRLPVLGRSLLIIPRLSLPHVNIRDVTSRLLPFLAKEELRLAFRSTVIDPPSEPDGITVSNKMGLHLSL
jgi:hypothetical protein